MSLGQLLKMYRLKNNYTQEQLARKLIVSHQSISKWEQGINFPSIDNLLLLSDIYNISLDELLRGSLYFRKPFIVGKKVTSRKIIGLLSLWLFISLFFTGFGYQPFSLFLALFIFGCLFILPITIEDYWIIENEGIRIYHYANKSIPKVKQIFNNRKNKEELGCFISYSHLYSFEIIYQIKHRLSPFDVNPDYFFITIKTEDDTFNLPISIDFVEYLPQAVSFIEKKGVAILDSNNLLPKIIAGDSLYDSMHQKN